ncbi:MAG: sigma-70 family RNA polymerase sigma factor [Phycisphaerales bacterium]
MPDPAPETGHELTRLLDAAAAGDAQAASVILPRVYGELRRLASAYLEGERAGHTLQPTALVHEVFLKLVGQRTIGWASRGEFMAIAAQGMRRVLCDHARIRKAHKRGGGALPVELPETLAAFEERAIDLPDFDSALTRLADLDPRKARVVELRFFAGLSVEETAQALGVPVRTIERDWTAARAWLREELERPSP